MTLTLPTQLIHKGRTLLAGALCAAFLLPHIATAQASVVLSVSPTLFEMSANREQSWSSTVRVINANEFPIRVFATPVNFAPSGEGGEGTLTPVFGTEADGSTLAEWITITEEEIVIEPERTVSVPFSIAVPEDAAPGGHFAAILIGTRPFNNGPGQAQVETSQVVTSLVFLSVAGDIQESGSIREFTSARRVYEQASAEFSLRFENTGNVHLQPQGEIEIRNMWGQERGRIDINKNSQFGNVLPESIRNYAYEWDSTWSVADIGRHSAEVTLAYGDTTRQFADSKTYFWVIPWKLLLLVMLILGGFFALISWGVKQYIKRMLQLAGVTPELQRQSTKSTSRPVSVTAPLEAGILDLRKELQEGSGSVVTRLWTFAKAYRAFMLVFAAVVVFVGLLLWYVVLVVQNDFEYDAQYEQPENVTSAPAEAIVDKSLTDIVVVNHSDDEAAILEIERKLSGLPYNILEESEPFAGSKERSVLVYHPEQIEVVTRLQAALPGILVSSFVTDDSEQPALILYIGNDVLQ